jgi:hypothetical protein
MFRKGIDIYHGRNFLRNFPRRTFLARAEPCEKSLKLGFVKRKQSRRWDRGTQERNQEEVPKAFKTISKRAHSIETRSLATMTPSSTKSTRFHVTRDLEIPLPLLRFNVQSKR